MLEARSMQNYVRDTRLSDKSKENPFVKVIESEEEPPTDDGEVQGGEGAGSHNIVYRWSNDVSTDDTEIIGPFESTEDCLEAAIDADNCPEPQKREKEMALHSVKIYAGRRSICQRFCTIRKFLTSIILFSSQ